MTRIETRTIEHTVLLKEEEMERAHEQKLKDELLMQSRAHRYHLHETLEQQVTDLHVCLIIFYSLPG